METVYLCTRDSFAEIVYIFQIFQQRTGYIATYIYECTVLRIVV